MRIPENQEEADAVRLVFGLRSAALKRVNEAQGQHESCLKAKCPELGVWCPAQLDLCALRESTVAFWCRVCGRRRGKSVSTVGAEDRSEERAKKREGAEVEIGPLVQYRH